MLVSVRPRTATERRPANFVVGRYDLRISGACFPNTIGWFLPVAMSIIISKYKIVADGRMASQNHEPAGSRVYAWPEFRWKQEICHERSDLVIAMSEAVYLSIGFPFEVRPLQMWER